MISVWGLNQSDDAYSLGIKLVYIMRNTIVFVVLFICLGITTFAQLTKEEKELYKAKKKEQQENFAKERSRLKKEKKNLAKEVKFYLKHLEMFETLKSAQVDAEHKADSLQHVLYDYEDQRNGFEAEKQAVENKYEPEASRMRRDVESLDDEIARLEREIQETNSKISAAMPKPEKPASGTSGVVVSQVKNLSYRIQIGASRTKGDAFKNLIDKHVAKMSTEPASNGMSRFMLGDFPTRAEANAFAEVLKDITGWDKVWIVSYRDGKRVK